MIKIKADFLDKAFMEVPLSLAEQERLDLLLYGQKLSGKGPWSEGPKAKRKKRIREIYSQLMNKPTGE